MIKKTCSSCKELKYLNMFAKHKLGKHGVASDCKVCFNSGVKEYFKTKHGLITKIYNSQKSSSRRRGHALPNYTLKELRIWMFSQPNFEQLYNDWVSSGYEKDLIPSCDRLKDNLPYTFDNLRLVTWYINRNNEYKNRKKGISPISKPVIATHIKTGEIIEFHSMMEAGRNGFHVSNISVCCSGTRKTHRNYKWKFRSN